MTHVRDRIFLANPNLTTYMAHVQYLARYSRYRVFPANTEFQQCQKGPFLWTLKKHGIIVENLHLAKNRCVGYI